MNYKIGEIIFAEDMIEINKDKESIAVKVKNKGDREIQIGSHYHFFEVNPALLFDREKTFGRHLDVPAGASIRFKAGEEKVVHLVEYSGKKTILGFNGLTMGDVKDAAVKEKAMANLKKFLNKED
jgi:urease subunit gamma/beta